MLFAKIFETAGIRPSYKSGHVSENISRGVKRRSKPRIIQSGVIVNVELDHPVGNHHKALVIQDSKIESANKKIRATKASVDRAEEQLIKAHRRAIGDPDSEKLQHAIERATRTRTNAETAYAKAV